MTTPRKYPLYKYLLALLDLLTVGAAYYLAFLFEERWLMENAPISPGLLFAEMVYVFFIGVVCVFIFHYLGLYQINVFITIFEHLLQIVKGLAILLSGIAVLSFFTKSDVIVDSRLLILFFALSALALFILVRVSLFRLLYLYASRNKLVQRNALIIGAGENGRNVAVNLFLHDYTGVRLVGFLDDDVAAGAPVFNGVSVVGKTADMADSVRRLRVEEILICLEEVDHTHLMELLERTMRLNVIVKVCSPLYEIIPLRRSIEHYGNVPVVGVFQSGISDMNEGYKRAFDTLVAALTLVLLAPLFALIAILVKLDSRGPVFYRQVRIGKNGREFRLYKFRSMTVGSDDDADREKLVAEFITSKEKQRHVEVASTKIVNEAHVTNVGKWLRRFSLDEFPQLINVLRGEMSIVGPRPCLPYEYAHYEEWHKRRMSVLPGLTGMWQVAGRSIVSFEDMVILDLHYIQNASIILDLRVMLKTIPVILFGTGAK
jgi:undecaprenyl-phosphate galactose phosphotransferase